MRETDYAYAVARIRANEGKLLTTAMLDELVAAPSFDRALALLRSHGWAEEGVTDVSALVAAQNERLWTLLQESVPDREELQVLTSLNDFYNLKAALKCMLTNVDPAPYYVQPTMLDLGLLTDAMRRHAFEKLPPSLADCAREAYETATRTESGQSADVIIDAAALACLSKQADETESALLAKILRFICDSTNIKIAVRCARTGKDLSFTQSAVGPCCGFDRDGLCAAAVQGESALLGWLYATPYRDGVTALQRSTTAFEKWCDDSIVALCREAKYLFFGFEPIAAYYFAKSAEIKAVRIVLSAKLSGVPAETIRERVRDLYV
ncbi:MAG: V-type ATPase subunit [Clostridia bacterium]|nr:V-type ATPase subunit [Clostridia bacterium]